ncbi:urea ABC transporter permease subunit UrtB [Gellertiella hungarica]|uniref:Urea transport system permease protein n=1 Tax=Gellertiella hungarica TaxID=1572859 RepID=A0A7W6J5Y7_9HYPH|nr:urea ABC transporter permease subunit UrtB [Gellertiella hungarica]MBB4065401.1 urea transport system permease protein [Gellertiella hungarica]
MDFVVSQILTGLSLSSILLLVALGLAIIYGVTGVINLAHGEFVMLGAYGAWLLQTQFGWNVLASLFVIFLAIALLGWLLEATVIRHLYDRPLDTILATWGLGVMIQQIVRLTAGGELRYVQMPPGLSGSVDILGATDSAYRLFVLGVALGLFALTWSIYRYTTFGLKLRAITQNRAIASSFGINSGQAYRATFAYGAGIAGLAGALISPLKSVSPEMGTTYVVDAFMVVVLGGVQSLMGTLASSAVLGEASGLLAYFSNDTIAKALVLVAIVIIIRFRPQGLFAPRVRA